MALSLLAHSTLTELQANIDPIKTCFDFIFSEDTDFPITSMNYDTHNTTKRSQEEDDSQLQNAYQEFNQTVHYVDSPPNSKDSWTAEYSKTSRNQGPTIIDVQTIYSVNNDRKRHMDWENLDINNSTTETVAISPKVPNLLSKERERKKSQGRGSWADEIDFDLNGEFSSNGYLNNEAFLSLSSALTVLKQEIPSPNVEAQRERKSSPQGKKNNQLSSKSSKCVGEEADISQSQQSTVTELNQNVVHNSITEHQSTTVALTSCYQQIIPQEKNVKSNSAHHSPSNSNSPKAETINDDFKFQYVLAAATSIATKSNEETLTYLNQGQSYEIKLKKIGDLTHYRGKILKSVIKICFHERRLQYMEREQMQQWQSARPGERIIEVDIPLSYGLCHVSQSLNPSLLNTVEALWDPMKEVGVYIKVNCISTEFTPKKHGGEKGVPFRIQIETFLENTISEASTKPIHAAACQIKVFKLKGADRKHKQDREKIQKRPPSEQEKYQPSYECTILNDIPQESIASQGCYSPEYIKPTVSPLMPNSPVHNSKYDSSLTFATNSSPVAINTVTSTNSTAFKTMDQNLMSPQQLEIDEYTSATITKESSTSQVAQWLTYHRLNAYITTFAHFSGSDVLRMSKEDFIQICGLADGIRMFNTLHAKAIAPRLTIYVSFDGSSYHAVYLISNTVKELIQKIINLPNFIELCTNNTNINGADNAVYTTWGMQSKYSGSGSNLHDSSNISVFVNGPSGIHVLVTNEVLNNIKDDSLFSLEIKNGKILMKANYKNDNN